MEKQSFVVLQIAHVNFGSELFHVGMLFDEQPAHMREEESSLWVMRISVCVCKLMMNTMVSDPLQDIFLRRQRLQEN